ncbi:DUF4920 domain-containing protein [Panacibacter ginsenosidivorans]|uniref:DUF4920 domain-containing protein n=1 Tax=Panacibacter ginsenosidivorans TaxID=1813871 RepID=A0A5B8VC79_9BACT|nr:DUF4920 domain-containing protein [Panacibacter ginsenosidivorans]QEC69044.1 DUF4920 domain-containing protein [Panacibacter ginsenosidivorans]
MKALYSFIILLLITAAVHAQPPNVPADKGATFGAKTTPEDAITVDQLASVMKSREGKKTEVKLKGTVTSVCESMGCWIKIRSADGDMMVKMKDHSFFVPLALNGKEVVVDGIAEAKETSVEELKDYAKDAGKSKEEVDAIKAPKMELTITAKGVLVL